MACGRLFSAASQVSAVLISRRNLSASSSAAVANAVREGSRQVLQRMEKSKGVVSDEKTSWMPDPVTGYFIPEDQFGQVDAAQLRQMLLSQKSTVQESHEAK